jgi:hypothetical protein
VAQRVPSREGLAANDNFLLQGFIVSEEGKQKRRSGRGGVNSFVKSGQAFDRSIIHSQNQIALAQTAAQ